jgi:imidazolonepropionase-like amidohydrolase
MPRVVHAGARIWDGRSAEPAAADLAVANGRIVDIGRDLDGDERVDHAGRTLIPGLFDCHVHVVLGTIDRMVLANRPFSYQFFDAARNLAATVRAGITSVRDAGGADLGVKQAVEEGLIPGPRLQISLSMLSQTGGHGDEWLPSGNHLSLLATHPGVPDTIVDGPDAMRSKVRELIRMGADVIKVATSGGVLSPRDKPHHAHFRPAELDVLVEEATAAGIFVMAHAQATDGIKNAVRSGIRSIEHGIFLDDEAVDLMLRRGTWLVPTLVAPQGVIEAADAGAQIGPEMLEKARAVVETHRASFAKAVEAGVRIAMGTDSGVTPHGRNLRELPLMAAGGMSPVDVLRATTRSAAELLGVEDERGSLEPGKLADFVVVDGDPFELERLPERIRDVYVDGVAVP